MLDTLVLASQTPLLDADARTDTPARTFVRHAARSQVRRLDRAIAAVGEPATDTDLHRVRIQAERTRYAIEAARPVIGQPAAEHAKALARLQDIIGDLHDSIVTVQWLRDAAQAQPTCALVAGQLIAAEYIDQDRLRSRVYLVLHAATAKHLRHWLQLSAATGPTPAVSGRTALPADCRTRCTEGVYGNGTTGGGARMSGPDEVLTREFPVIALVCSTGGLEALTTVLASLPADLPAAVVALQHVSPYRRSLLPEILRRCTALPVHRAHDGDALIPGQVLVAPEAAHLIVSPDGCVRLIPSDGAPRPSADLLLCTLAVAMRSRAIAVVLTGAGQDGATGVEAVDLLGGVTLVEDPCTAQSSGMPEAARCRNRPTATLPLSAIGPALQELVHRSPDHDGRHTTAKTA